MKGWLKKIKIISLHHNTNTQSHCTHTHTHSLWAENVLGVNAHNTHTQTIPQSAVLMGATAFTQEVPVQTPATQQEMMRHQWKSTQTGLLGLIGALAMEHQCVHGGEGEKIVGRKQTALTLSIISRKKDYQGGLLQCVQAKWRMLPQSSFEYAIINYFRAQSLCKLRHLKCFQKSKVACSVENDQRKLRGLFAECLFLFTAPFAHKAWSRTRFWLWEWFSVHIV